MNRTEILQQIDRAIERRVPKLAAVLRPGLARAMVARRLQKVTGLTTPLVDLFTWHNGVDLQKIHAGGIRPSLEELAVVPGELYQLLELDTALAHFLGWVEVAKFNPKLVPAVGRYFPVLWDGATSWLALDLSANGVNRIVVIEFESDQPIREGYPSVDSYLSDLLRANSTGTTLRIFDK